MVPHNLCHRGRVHALEARSVLVRVVHEHMPVYTARRHILHGRRDRDRLHSKRVVPVRRHDLARGGAARGRGDGGEDGCRVLGPGQDEIAFAVDAGDGTGVEGPNALGI